MIYLFQQTEVELGEDTMPLKIGEWKLVLKRITNSIVCYTWSHVHLVCMTVHLAGTDSKLWEIGEHKGLLYISRRIHVICIIGMEKTGRGLNLECRWNSSVTNSHNIVCV